MNVTANVIPKPIINEEPILFRKSLKNVSITITLKKHIIKALNIEAKTTRVYSFNLSLTLK